MEGLKWREDLLEGGVSGGSKVVAAEIVITDEQVDGVDIGPAVWNER